MKKIVSVFLLVFLIVVSKKDVLAQQVIKVWQNENIGKNVKITQPGVYQIKGKVTGNINIAPKSGKIILEGVGANAQLTGIPWGGGTRRHVSHFAGTISGNSQVEVRNIKIKGDGHNAMEFNGNGFKLIENVVVVNNDTTINGKKYSHVGSINAGQNSEIRNSILYSGDDGIKITEPNSAGYNSTVEMRGNGSAIQLGWGNRCDGPNHIAKNITVRGFINANGNHSNPNNDSNTGRSVIGGIFKNPTSNVEITNLKVHGKNYGRIIKFIADGAVVRNVTIEGDLLNGISKKSAGGKVWYPIVLIARNGGRFENMTIDLAGVDLTKQSVRNEFVSMTGTNNIDVTWKTHASGGNGGGGGNNGDSPGSPSELTLKPNCDQVAITWKDNADNEDAYSVRRKPIGGGTAVTLATLAAGSTSFIDKTVSESTGYEYKVRAINSNGVGATSWTPVTTKACPSGDAINITEVATDCNNSGKARNVISFTVNMPHTQVTSNKGIILKDDKDKYRLREVGVPFNSNTNYKITVMQEGKTAAEISETVSAVNSCTGKKIAFPNPVKSELNLGGLDKKTKAYILDSTGEVMLKGKGNGAINVSKLRSGTYIIRFSDGETMTFIKE